MYVKGKLRVLNFTGFSAASGINVVTLGQAHLPYSNVYGAAAVGFSGKTYFGYIASIISSTTVTFNAYYLPSYGAAMSGLPARAGLYGVIAYFTA